MATTTNPTTVQPAFKRVSQGDDRHADTFAVIAMLTGKTLQDIFRQAEGLGLPKSGPYYPWIDGDLIAKLLAAHGLVATVWKDCTGYKDLPEVAIAGVDANSDWDVSRCVLYHRNTSSDGKTTQPYVIDPYPHADAKLHLRTGADLTALTPAWFIGVSQMAKTTAK
ncbi:hypothetical protein HND92_12240 [Diaphorobacter sp. JS3050]|uniref:hypothetical protein n=1 Tax=Diaphorobacter sp. JS3050 TaxID=2735554 RepID=UPI001555F192|nr:hypothetical protein [Diaphorobacter sp. JS3050]QJY33653.1 hypothetical protein HND92_12240 [Diaphorobacter sp. JS3050]